MLAPVEVGQKAPNFTLSDDRGQSITLSALRGKPVVLYFYPRDNTPGCTREACAFRDRRAELARRGARVLGVSTDSVASHARFRDLYQLNFPLLADPQHVVAETYGSWAEKTLYGKKSWGLVRSTFLIDGEGVVRRIWRKVQVDGHDAAVLAALDDLNGSAAQRSAAPAVTEKVVPAAKPKRALPKRAVQAASASRSRRTAEVGAATRRTTKKTSAATKRRTSR